MLRKDLLKNKECCGLGCKCCPYTPSRVKGSKQINYLYCERCGAIDDIYSGYFLKFKGSSETIHKILCQRCKDAEAFIEE
jgi:hypothetical protein